MSCSIMMAKPIERKTVIASQLLHIRGKSYPKKTDIASEPQYSNGLPSEQTIDAERVAVVNDQRPQMGGPRSNYSSTTRPNPSPPAV